MHIAGSFLLISFNDISILMMVVLSLILVTQCPLDIHLKVVEGFDIVWEELM